MGEKKIEAKLKLYDEVGKLSSQDVSPVIVRDQGKDTLNLVVTTWNKVAELRMNLKNIPTTHMIHLHR